MKDGAEDEMVVAGEGVVVEAQVECSDEADAEAEEIVRSDGVEAEA